MENHSKWVIATKMKLRWHPSYLANPDVMALACRSWLLDAYRDEVCILHIKEAPKNFRQLYMVYRLSAQQNNAVYEFLTLAKEHFTKA